MNEPWRLKRETNTSSETKRWYNKLRNIVQVFVQSKPNIAVVYLSGANQADKKIEQNRGIPARFLYWELRGGRESDSRMWYLSSDNRDGSVTGTQEAILLRRWKCLNNTLPFQLEVSDVFSHRTFLYSIACTDKHIQTDTQCRVNLVLLTLQKSLM